MNKKVYIQPQVWTVSTYAECSGPVTGSTGTEYLNGQKPGSSTDIQNGGSGGKDDLNDSKGNWSSIDSWDSWD